MKQRTRQRKQGKFSKDVTNVIWVALVLIIVLSVITGLVVNFFENVHYNNLLSQANNQAGSIQTELNKEQYDVKLLIDNGNGQFNCYELRSDYARNLCFSHQSTP